jgi:outer membrane protein OmpA-like peptidoglycan-associated protein
MSRRILLPLAALLALIGLGACRTADQIVEETPFEESIPAPVTAQAPDASVAPGVAVESAQDQVVFNYESPILQVLSNAFSPNGDGYRDELEFYASVPTTRGFKSWDLTLFSEGHSEIFKISGTSLVPGSFTWDGNSPGGRPVADGWYYGRLTISYEDGNWLTAHSSKFLLWREGPRGRISVPAGYFSPDGDGVNDTITVALAVENRDEIVAYQVALYNSRDSLFELYSAPGAPPEEFTWDGTNRAGETVESAEDYRLELRMWDDLGNVSTINGVIPVDILVYRDGDQIKIRIAAITFLPYSANYFDVAPDQRAKNLQTLDRLAEILKKFADYRITLQGHAVQIYWNDPVRGKTEQESVLIPLSTARADAIRQALIARGVAADRMTSSGVGALQPLVPNSDLENRWINRRVEFVLDR